MIQCCVAASADDYSALSGAAVPDDVEQNAANFELPPPPMPPPFDDLPPGPPSPTVTNSNPSAFYPQLDSLAESPLPLPPEDVNFDAMVVPPPPPPLVEYEQPSTKLNGMSATFDYFRSRLIYANIRSSSHHRHEHKKT